MKSLNRRVGKLEQALTGTSSVVQMMRLLSNCDKPQLLILSGPEETEEEPGSPDVLEQLQVYDRDGTVYDYENECYRELTEDQIGDRGKHPKKLSADEVISQLGKLLNGIEGHAA